MVIATILKLNCSKFVQLIFRKIRKIVATISPVLRLYCFNSISAKTVSLAGSGALQRSSRPSSWISGVLFIKWREWRESEGGEERGRLMDRRRREKRGKEGKRRNWEEGKGERKRT